MLKIIDIITLKIEEYTLAYSVICMSLLLIANVLARLLFNSSIVFAEEVGRYLIIVATFVGISHLARLDKHIKVSALLDYSSRRTKKILAVLISSVTSLTFFWLSFIAFRYMLTTISSGRVSPVLGIPIYLVAGLVTMGIFFTAVQYLSIFILNLKTKEIYLGRTPERTDK